MVEQLKGDGQRTKFAAKISALYDMIEDLNVEIKSEIEEVETKVIEKDQETLKLNENKAEYIRIIQEIHSDQQFFEDIKKSQIFNNQKTFFKIANTLIDNECFNKFLKANGFKGKFSIEICEDFKKEIFEFKLNEWVETITKFVSTECHCKIDELRAVVIGMNGIDEFNTNTAFVEDELFDNTFDDLPTSVQNLINYLDAINSKFGFSIVDEQEYDYKAMSAKKHGFLFLNSCLSTNPNQIINCLYSLKFVNQILKLTKDIAVVDMRKSADNFKEIDKFINVENYNDLHHIVSLDYPLYWDNYENFHPDDSEEIRQLNSLIEKGYEINCIFMGENRYNELLTCTSKKDPKTDFDQCPQDVQNLKNTRNSSTDFLNSYENQSLENNNTDQVKSGNVEQDCVNELDYNEDEINELFTNNDFIQIEDILRVLLTMSVKNKWNVYCTELQEVHLAKLEDKNLYQNNSKFEHLYKSIETLEKFVLIESKQVGTKAIFFNDKRKKFEFEFLGIKIKYDKLKYCIIMDQIETIQFVIDTINKLSKDDVDEIEKMLKRLDDVCKKTRPDICSAVKIIKCNDLNSSEKLQALKYLTDYLDETKLYQYYLNPIEAACLYSDASYKSIELDVQKKETRNPNFILKYNTNNQAEAPTHQKTDTKSTNLPENGIVEEPLRIADLDRFQTGYIIELYRCYFTWNSIGEKRGFTSAYLETIGKLRAAEKIAKIYELFEFLGFNCLSIITAFIDCKSTPKNVLPIIKNRIVKLTNPSPKEKMRIKFPYITSNNNIADKFTKPELRIQNNKIDKDFLNLIGLRILC